MIVKVVVGANHASNRSVREMCSVIAATRNVVQQ